MIVMLSKYYSFNTEQVCNYIFDLDSVSVCFPFLEEDGKQARLKVKGEAYTAFMHWWENGAAKYAAYKFVKERP